MHLFFIIKWGDFEKSVKKELLNNNFIQKNGADELS